MRSMAALVMKGRPAALATAILMSATAFAAGGCTSGHSELGTSSSVCFRAIPVGRAAVAGPSPGKPVPNSFVGVRSASLKDIDKFGSTHDALEAELTMRNGGPLKSLCLVAFHGSFEPTEVQDLLGPVPPAGHRVYAVTVISEPSNKLLATVLRSKEPLDFTHYVVGD